jgi:hypothetical protein
MKIWVNSVPVFDLFDPLESTFSNIVSNHSNRIFRNLFGARRCILLRVAHKPHSVSEHVEISIFLKFSVTGAKTAR